MNLDDSLQNVLSQKEPVIQDFYHRFLEECPEAARLFEGVDLKRQALMLTMALMMVEAHARKDFPAIRHYLHVLGDRHREWGVPRELFPRFRECLIETLAVSQQDDWSDELADEWRTAITRATEVMFEGYAGSYPF